MSWLRADGDRLVWCMQAADHLLLTVLLTELDEALDGPTDDAVVQRLFPPAVEGDRDEDDELRMLIAADLLMQRHEAIAQLLVLLRGAIVHAEDDRPFALDELLGDDETLDVQLVDVVLVEDEPTMMLSTLNDVRLALAQRIGLTAVELPQLVDEDDERSRTMLHMIDRLAYFQLQLLEQIDPVSVAHAEPDED